MERRNVMATLLGEASTAHHRVSSRTPSREVDRAAIAPRHEMHADLRRSLVFASVARERTETPVHTYLVLATSSAFVRTGSKAASRLARLVRRPAQSTARS
jgi:hypothetical protein